MWRQYQILFLQKRAKKKSICITGAGGSIGSEIARQCIAYGASSIVLYDFSEYSLYKVEEELKLLIESQRKSCSLISVLGSVLDEGTLTRTLKVNDVKTVYHAAAYKHVPMVEANVFEGTKNNAIGVNHVAAAVTEAGVERRVLISTDKAVRPTNVMGASKRVAELIVKDWASSRNRQTVFSTVRFGNVLGSSGSVVPLFEKQIKAGGPVTVTHPEVTRYFMSISEAATLVVQAGSIAKGGEVLLDMGESVRISELAERMIRLSGFQSEV